MTNKPWFRGKKHGKGWGLPTGKEGWLVVISYLLLVFLMTIQLNTKPTPNAVGIYAIQVILATILLFVICYASGEKPNWKWGEPINSKHKK